MEKSVKKDFFDWTNEAKTNIYKPIPFWSINAALEKDEIIRQIEEMHSYGLGGFVFHARTGLETEYLSETWFEMVEASLDTAKRLGMQVWLYDENGWPSGFIGGKLLENEENRAGFLRYEMKNVYDENAYAVYEYNETDGVRLLMKGEQIEGVYHTIYKMKSDAYTDILNPRVTDCFIEGVYQKYYERFGSRFGKEFVGFFTDEPQYYRYETPISAVTEAEYKKSYGKELKDGLLYLFLQDEKGYAFRCEYYNLMNRLYCENYYQRLMDWCEARGVLLTGHSVEETYMTTQMWGGADCATTYCCEHIPAIDNLEKALTAEISAKSVGSVAAQIGKKYVFTETFGISGASITPKQLKLIGDKQYVYGVNRMIQHLYCYSLAGQGKIDCPPSFGRTLPWLSGYPELNQYFERLGYIIANSSENVPVAVITPMESVYLNYLRLDEQVSSAEVDQPFMQILEALRRRGIAYHFVNEKILEKLGDTKDGELVVGACTYKAVVLANNITLKKTTNDLLARYKQEGGRICVVGNMPKYVDGIKTEMYLSANCDISELPKPVVLSFDGVLSYSYRNFNEKKLLFIVNESSAPIMLQTEVPFSRLDLLENKGYAATYTQVVPAEGSILLEENGAYEEAYPSYHRRMSILPKFVGSDKNSLTIENVVVQLKNGETLDGYVYGVFETLMKRGYADELIVRFCFDSDCERPIVLTREKQSVYDVNFNGRVIAFSQADEDINFEYAEAQAKIGQNIYEYKVDFGKLQSAAEILYKKDVLESLLNCLTYHTGLEPIYVAGQFDVDGYTLREKKEKRVGDLTLQGYENFYGKVVYTFRLETAIKGYLKPIGSYAQCIVKTADKRYCCMLEEGVLVELPAGDVDIECYSTLRNRFGPFHYGAPVDDRIGPDTFTLRNHWVDEKTNKFYYALKRVIPFGLDRIEIEY